MRLGVGGDDITEFLSVLLKRIYLPYKEMDLIRSYDWNVMEDLKAKMCTLTEVSVLEASHPYLYIKLVDRVISRPIYTASRSAGLISLL